jgi:aryl-alcohol dehydrogenase-like predicted oxidoreductase
MLDHALACGITHFDAARAYGFGRTEGILGEFLRGKRAQVTVATKSGLQPPAGLGGNRWVIDAAKKVLTPFPALLRRAKRRGESASRRNFSSEAAVESLHASLRELGTDYVDLLLLHEATLADAASEDLIAALEKQVAAGKVRSLGVASDFRRIGPDAGSLPGAYQAVQFNDNAGERNLERLMDPASKAVITHSVFKPAPGVANAARARPQAVSEWSAKIGADLGDKTIVGALLLQYALEANQAGVVLFSSMSAARVASNVKAAESPVFSKGQVSQFLEFIDEILSGDAAVEVPRANAS